MKDLISIVISIFNEDRVIKEFYDNLVKHLNALNGNYIFELIFVNDGSTDQTRSIIDNFRSHEGIEIKIIHFSRNFGHEAAMIAGIDYSSGTATICMDADLQHPPEKISEMLDCFKNGNDIILMIRNSRGDGGFFKNLLSNLFYNFLNLISDEKIERNASDFFLISKRVVSVLKTNYRDKTRFIRGIIQSIGFKKNTLLFDAPKRLAGESKYSFFKLLILSLSAITIYSKAPLRLNIFFSILFGAISCIIGIYSIIMKIFGNPFSGYTTIIVFLSFGFCILFLMLAIMSEYIGNIFSETKNKPIYLIDEIKDLNQ